MLVLSNVLLVETRAFSTASLKPVYKISCPCKRLDITVDMFYKYIQRVNWRNYVYVRKGTKRKKPKGALKVPGKRLGLG